ncbi:MAG: adenylate/guanylate cyclase domain-containing protein [Alphaproteobacteria bacterium]|nr:adenylate/guanylate cyclase domain-containing protein [Alphaproteobacteria bacterium]
MPDLTGDPRDLPSPLSGRPVAGVITGPPMTIDQAWSLLGDSDRMNRIGGNDPMDDLQMRPADDGLPTMLGAMRGPAGMALPFEEAWTSWVQGQWFRQIRTIDSPFLTGTDYAAALAPDGDRVRPHMRLALYGPTLSRPLLTLRLRSMLGRCQKALDDLPVRGLPSRELPGAADASLQRWAQDDPEGLVEPMRALLQTGAPTELRRLRPFALADRWGMDRGQVLEGMLRGVLSGTLELYWSVRCVRCYGQVAGGALLSDLADHAACPSCRIEFDNDLGSNVEVMMAPHPAVAPRIEETFCTMYPAGAPEQLAVWTMAPGETLETELTLAPGRFHLGAGGGLPDVSVTVQPEAAAGADALSWAPREVQDPAALAAGAVRVRLHNEGATRRRVQLTRDGGQEARVPASLLTTLPSFRRQFSHQVLAPDLRLSVRSVALLFTDLSGSTAMYEELGDARAFAVVRDHFSVLRPIVEDHGGVVVKTIGDAVMAAFDSPLNAARAAVAMQRAFAAFAGALPIQSPPGLKVGVHFGPALAVHSDQAGLDWFGGTVNLAARAEGQASRGDIILTRAAADDAQVVAWLAQQGLAVEPVERQVKGFSGPVTFLRLRA